MHSQTDSAVSMPAIDDKNITVVFARNISSFKGICFLYIFSAVVRKYKLWFQAK